MARLHRHILMEISLRIDALHSFGFDRSLLILMKDSAIPDVSCILVLLCRIVVVICL